MRRLSDRDSLELKFFRIAPEPDDPNWPEAAIEEKEQEKAAVEDNPEDYTGAHSPVLSAPTGRHAMTDQIYKITLPDGIRIDMYDKASVQDLATQLLARQDGYISYIMTLRELVRNQRACAWKQRLLAIGWSFGLIIAVIVIIAVTEKLG